MAHHLRSYSPHLQQPSVFYSRREISHSSSGLRDTVAAVLSYAQHSDSLLVQVLGAKYVLYCNPCPMKFFYPRPENMCASHTAGGQVHAVPRIQIQILILLLQPGSHLHCRQIPAGSNSGRKEHLNDAVLEPQNAGKFNPNPLWASGPRHCGAPESYILGISLRS